ncbi:hypothetical protein BDK51DRAFT_47632 [Blyttiomyces helicus]|uniref:Uncharacterized protein n=1 Tax=Blyttiomyces helicus TaxID=388810 RepID=A0A4P9WFA2_9FUNG|nr:hypothetical protein BDK51DRAFT_47632 [Blyttiomyces helicus]|eukprot:RKO90515.1 hypothetical protein BDK51DRAFT_47632 [Blyttiomyces helicus]
MRSKSNGGSVQPNGKPPPPGGLQLRAHGSHPSPLRVSGLRLLGAPRSPYLSASSTARLLRLISPVYAGHAVTMLAALVDRADGAGSAPTFSRLRRSFQWAFRPRPLSVEGPPTPTMSVSDNSGQIFLGRKAKKEQKGAPALRAGCAFRESDHSGCLHSSAELAEGERLIADGLVVLPYSGDWEGTSTLFSLQYFVTMDLSTYSWNAPDVHADDSPIGFSLRTRSFYSATLFTHLAVSEGAVATGWQCKSRVGKRRVSFESWKPN